MRIVFSLLALLAISCSAQAGVIDSLFNGEVTKLEDVDYEIALDGGDGSLDVGDYLLTIIEFGATRLAASNDLVFDASASTDAITGVALFKVAGVSQVFAGSDAILSYALTGATSAEWLAQAGLAGIGDGTALVAYHDPISAPAQHIVNAPTVAAGVASATHGTKIFEFAVDNNFLGATVSDLIGGTFNAYDAANVDGFTSAGAFVSTYNGLPGVTLVEHDFNNFGFDTELQLIGGFESKGGAGAFDFVTDSDVYLHAVPEPGTGLAFIGITMVTGFVRRRRQS
ncbi:PEP-CTERM sorting domain-containing protein [Stieleria sp. TO1_6]|uniref:PEP-CTERM sorting domain-containing protein n=1 Tax=Stieleria tagensis TaxID=2956795 RepID=UPI00209AB11D|nr:PEP-CTERM sorting domain-containing protein [Stieleria tagensis]MCO8122512.1 PEP-CTERM sorting domain-containing protein [Stieleria tagensis]